MNKETAHGHGQEPQQNQAPSKFKITRRGFIGGALGALGLSVLGAKMTGVLDGSSDSSPAKIERATSVEDFDSAVREVNQDVENALRSGKVELNGPNDWEKYFTPISQDNASKLLELSDASPFAGGFILPLDPRISPNLIIEMSSSKGANGTENAIAIKNVANGTRLYSPFKGELLQKETSSGTVYAVDRQTIKRSAGPRGTELALPAVERAELIVPSENIIPSNSTDAIDIGTPFVSLMSRDSVQLGTDIVYRVGKTLALDEKAKPSEPNKDNISYDNSLEQFLRYKGKIPFFETLPFHIVGNFAGKIS